MKYNEALQSINPKAALKALKIEGKEQGAYIHFPCPQCQEDAVIKAFGEKKNLWLCTKCKLSGHIISLAMNRQKMDYEDAKNFLLSCTQYPNEEAEELNLDYTLEWCEFMEQEGLDKDWCEELGVGKPKGKTILAGYLAFTVLNENRKKVAYVGQRISDGKHYIPKNFNPELYLYNFCNIINPDEETIITPDVLDCARLLGQGKQAISTFWLTYISRKQLEYLQMLQYISLTGFGEETVNVAIVLARLHGGFHRFI